MAIIKAFRGIRPTLEKAEIVASKPYDVIRADEARAEIKANPLSFLRVVRSEAEMDESVDTHSVPVYERARDNLKSLISDGVMVQDDKDNIYLYQQEMDGRVQTGIVAAVSVEDYNKNVIKKHEHTRHDKEQDRINHVDYCGANTGPVFLTYRNQENVNKTVASWTKDHSPTYNFTTSDKVRHTFWVVDDETVITSLVNEFGQIQSLYVADGHHRSAAAAKVGEIRRNKAGNSTGKENYNFFLAVLFPDQELHIMDYNRVVKDLNGLSSTDFLEKLNIHFEVQPKDAELLSPEQKHQIGMYLDGKWYLLTGKAESINEEDPIKSLDVYLLQQYVLNELLGISDPRTDNRIDFIGGIRGTEELVRLCKEEDWKVAFSMYPTSIHDLMRVADADLVMPPKSTWFEPKLRSGLIIHELD